MKSTRATWPMRVLLRLFPGRFRSRHGRSLERLVVDLTAADPSLRNRRRVAGDLVRQAIEAHLDRLFRGFGPESAIPAARGSAADSLRQDLRYGVQALRCQPGVSLVVIATLALGIGANSAIFAIINHVVLTPLPIPASERIYRVYEVNERRGADRSNVAWANFQDLLRSDSIEAGGAMAGTDVTLESGDYPERIRAIVLSGEVFEVLGMHLSQGRGPTAQDQVEGAAEVAVLAESFWQQRFGRDTSVLGTPIRINGRARTVIGIVSDLPIADADIFLPLAITESQRSRTRHDLEGLVRAVEGASITRLHADADTISASLRAEYPDSYGDWRYRLLPLQASLLDDGWSILVFLFGIVGAVLLIACVNVTNVLLARGAIRRREIAVRAAIGAGRGRLVRQLLTESLLLALLGAVAAVAVAQIGVGFLRTSLPLDFPGAEDASLDFTVLLFTLGVATLSGLTFGIGPALTGSRVSLGETLRESGPGSTPGGKLRLRNGMVVGQICATVALLLVAGLLARTLIEVATADLGFDPGSTVIMRLDVGASAATVTELEQLTTRLLADTERLGNVAAAALTSQIPMGPSRTYRGFKLVGDPDPPVEEARYANWVSVTPGYFTALGMRLDAGRPFSAGDDAEADPVIILNTTMARELFGDRSGVGRRVHIFTDEALPREVIGVIDDIIDRPFDDTDRPQFYTPLSQAFNTRLSLVVNTTADPAAVVTRVRDELRRLDASIPVYDVRTLGEVVSASVAGPRTITFLVGGFALLALALASLGLYGVIAHTVTRRTHELGVRIALGADRARVLRMVVAHGVRMVGTAVPIGTVIALGLAALIRTEFRRLEMFDPIAWILVVALTLVAVLAASYVPARRATKVDPLVALRTE